MTKSFRWPGRHRGEKRPDTHLTGFPQRAVDAVHAEIGADVFVGLRVVGRQDGAQFRVGAVVVARDAADGA